jgi:hypothetical protein
MKHKIKKTTVSLGELISTVSGYAANEREVLVAIHDLFRKGSVVAHTAHGLKRLKLG